jgi:tetratricopeptide (TPR) repeat protein
MRNLFLLVICWLGLPLLAQEWSHVLPADLYKELSLTQRAAVDKALDLYEKGKDGQNNKEKQFHKSAATEWERFRVQHGDTVDPAVFAYSLFMQGMSQNRASDRHTAIKTFTEVLDFFPDEIWLAAPALYFRAMTHYEIGDERKGLTDLNELLKDPDYRKHALAAFAYNKVAENHWQNKRTAEAVAYWEIVANDFSKKNRDANRDAKSKLNDWTIVQGEISEVLERYIDGQRKGSDLDRKLNASKALFEDVRRRFDREYKSWYYDAIVGGKKGEEQRKARLEDYRKWFYEQEALFLEAGRMWEFLMIQFEDTRENDPKKLEALIVRISGYLRKSPDEKQLGRAKDLLKRLLNVREYAMARSLLEFYPDATERMWVTYDIEYRQKKYEAADLVLGQLLESQDAKVVDSARRSRANLYHKNMSKYDEAIKLYYEINDPPKTLWDIADCQRRKGDKKGAQNTLTEVASIFPDQASRAIYAKAEYFRQDGEKKMAIGLYRNLLGHPEWKKSGEASKAHDRLEDMGIDTGGAVINEVH